MTALESSAGRGSVSEERASGPAAPYDAAVADLLGAMACAELLAFERLAHDATLAPTLDDKAELARMAVAEFNHYTVVRGRLAALGVDPTAAMEPFVDALTEFHRRTAASDWLEGLVKAYVGDGMAADFYREIASHLDDGTRALVLDVLADTGHSNFVVPRVRAAIAADPRLAGRLALWGRRLVGEIMTEAQRLAGEREALASLIIGGTGPDGQARAGIDLNEIGRMLGRLTDAHTVRMTALGFDA